ncbi:MAG: hypothetical protein GY845_35430 [Planctomycetes bacterium]|nr:hypothetical protein [Planctomycetota bacterium]
MADLLVGVLDGVDEEVEIPVSKNDRGLKSSSQQQQRQHGRSHPYSRSSTQNTAQPSLMERAQTYNPFSSPPPTATTAKTKTTEETTAAAAAFSKQKIEERETLCRNYTQQIARWKVAYPANLELRKIRITPNLGLSQIEALYMEAQAQVQSILAVPLAEQMVPKIEATLEYVKRNAGKKLASRRPEFTKAVQQWLAQQSAMQYITDPATQCLIYMGGAMWEACIDPYIESDLEVQIKK